MESQTFKRKVKTHREEVHRRWQLYGSINRYFDYRKKWYGQISLVWV